MMQILLSLLIFGVSNGGALSLRQAMVRVQKMEYVSVKQVRALRAKIENQYAGRGVPYSLVNRIIGKVSHGHVNQLLRNWYFIPREDRTRIVRMFEDAGLKHLTFLSLYESGGLADDLSHKGAVGLYQITMPTAKAHCGIDMREELYDPVVNAACAIEILQEKGVRENLAFGLIMYNGKLKSCPARGYFDCLREKLQTETDENKKRQYLGSLMYVPNVLLHQAIGEEFVFRRDGALR